ncbi:MAG TPA: hypothetical protein VLC08_01885, partial [Chitinolyticbacter sp.]|nr:hypothetical protein [Chitinolyticbacter sp.]
GVRCVLSIRYGGRTSDPKAQISLKVESERAGALRKQAEFDLLGKPWEKCSSFSCVLQQLNVAGEIWTDRGVVLYDYCRSLEELYWLAEVTLHRLPAMVALTESIAGINVLKRERLSRFWNQQNSFGQLFDYAYLIWGNQLAEFEELAARQLEWHRQSGRATSGFELEQLIDYCRSNLKPDPDGLP